MQSRRQFLKFTGIALAGSHAAFRLPFTQISEEVLRGRALYSLPVFSHPNNSQIVTLLWPDSVTTISSIQGDWYQVSGGYVQRNGLQPMMSYDRVSDVYIPVEPFWGEVSAPVAAVRDHCSAGGQLITRIGHGGVAQIVDYLPEENGGWYAIANDQGTVLGWSQATLWQPVSPAMDSTQVQRLEINLSEQRITAWDGGNIVLQAPCSTDASAVPGHYAVCEKRPSGTLVDCDAESTMRYGTPWQTHFGEDMILGGIYWHNNFGKPIPGMTIQVTPLAARWLHDWLDDTSEIVLI